jgi:hypothetical protein
MTLVVDFSDFPDAIKRFRDSEAEPCAFYKKVGDSIELTFVNPRTQVQIVSGFSGAEEEAVAALSQHGICVQKGVWVTEASLEHLARLAGEGYIVSVAYETNKGPGLWVDAFPYPPTEGGALRYLFEEFVSEGYLGERDFELFVHDTKPIVRIIGPEEIEKFLAQKRSSSI